MRIKGRWLVTLWLILASCGARRVGVGGDLAADGGVARDAQPRADAGAPLADAAVFCSGAAKVSFDHTPVAVEQVAAEDFNSAAHAEGARVRFVVQGAGGRWQVDAEIKAPQGVSLVGQPLPHTASLGPSGGLEAMVYLTRPPRCGGASPCNSHVLLSTEHHRFLGHATLTGDDYRQPLRLELCLSASDEGWVAADKNEVHKVRVYVPDVRIPRWRLPWAP